MDEQKPQPQSEVERLRAEILNTLDIATRRGVEEDGIDYSNDLLAFEFAIRAEGAGERLSPQGWLDFARKATEMFNEGDLSRLTDEEVNALMRVEWIYTQQGQTRAAIIAKEQERRGIVPEPKP